MNFTKEDKNKAWKEMSGILDQEMPVRKSRDRFFLILLFFLIGLTGISVYFGKNVFIQNDIDDTLISTANKVPLTENEISKNLEKQKINLINPKETIHEGIIKETDNQNKSQSNNNLSNSNKNEILIDDEIPIIKTGKSNDFEISDFKNSIESKEESDSFDKINIIKIPNKINNLKSRQQCDISDPNILVSNFNDIKKNNISVFNPYTYCNLYNPDFSKLYPYFDIGIGNTVFFNKKFHMDIALGILDSRIVFPEISLVTFGRNDNLETNSLFEYKNTDSIQRYNMQKSLFYITLSEAWNIDRKLTISIGAGAIYSYPLNKVILSDATNEIFIYENVDGLIPEKTTTYSINKNIISKYTFFNEININYKVKYKLSINTGLKYFYTHYDIFYDSINNEIYKSQISKYPLWHNIYLGLKYNF